MCNVTSKGEESNYISPSPALEIGGMIFDRLKE